MSRVRIFSIFVSLFLTPVIAATALADTPIHLEAVKSGLEKAIAQRIIPKDGFLETGITQFLALVQQGYLPEDASLSTGVKLSVIYRLEQLGMGTAPVAMSPVSQTVSQSMDKGTVPVVTVIKPVAASIEAKPLVTAIKAKAHPRVAFATQTSTRPSPKIAERYLIANALVRGLAVANRTREIGYRAPLSFRVQSLVRALRSGDGLERAQRVAQVPQQTVDRLLTLGNYQR